MEKNFKNTMIAVLLVCILIMAVGYAALQQRLNISGTSNITSVWDVQITNIVSHPSGGASDAVAPSFTPITATFSSNLVNPNDSITYDVTIENKGTLDAELKLITNNSENNPAISFIYSGIKEGNILKAGTSTHAYVTVKYNDVTTQPDDVNSNFTIILDYIQYVPKAYGDISTVSYLQEMSTSYGNWMNGAFRGSDIESLVFVDSKEVPSGAYDMDVSAQDNGEVVMWWLDEDSDGKKEVYVGQDGGVIANPNSSYLFYDLDSLELLDLTHLDTHYVTNMSNMFKYTSAPVIDVSGFDTSNVTTMNSMFWGLGGATKLDVSTFNTSKVTDMASMFKYASSLEEIIIKGIDTTNVTDMNSMFNGIDNIKTIDLTGLNTSNVENMNNMFSQSGFTSLDLSSLNTSKVTDMSKMFMQCDNLSSLNVDIDTSKVTNMEGMFREMSSIEVLDLSSFNTSSVTSTTFMFYYNTGVKTIYASDLWNMGSVKSSTYMFGSNNNLVGDNNYKFNSGRTSASYAKYNGQGYLTYKAYN